MSAGTLRSWLSTLLWGRDPNPDRTLRRYIMCALLTCALVIIADPMLGLSQSPVEDRHAVDGGEVLVVEDDGETSVWVQCGNVPAFPVDDNVEDVIDRGCVGTGGG